MEKQNRLILIAGSIGSGKTTLTHLLGEQCGWDTGYEAVENNPYLSDFYYDMNKWSFHLGVYFLCSRAKQHKCYAGSNTIAVLDRSIYEDIWVFMPALHQEKAISKRDYETYLELWEMLEETLPLPNLLIYLYASPDFLLKRIRSRGRSIEKGIDLKYLQLLDKYYQKWILTFSTCPVLKVNIEQQDFLNNLQHRNSIISQIKHILHPKTFESKSFGM